MGIILKSAREIAIMRQAGRVAAEALAEVAAQVRPGVTTAYLDHVAYEAITRRGAIPSFKGYRGFPASLCTSLNHEVVHGIPGPRRLVEGDIISLDLGAIVDGYHGDLAVTVPVGKISPQARRLLEVTAGALWAGIRAARNGNRLGDISAAIQQHAERHGYNVVREFVGHGIGRSLHEEPSVPNFGSPGVGPLLKPGMTLALEPMVNAGKADVRQLRDGWTVVTVDGNLSAHFEHTITITDGEAEVLTPSPLEGLKGIG